MRHRHHEEDKYRTYRTAPVWIFEYVRIIEGICVSIEETLIGTPRFNRVN